MCTNSFLLLIPIHDVLIPPPLPHGCTTRVQHLVTRYEKSDIVIKEGNVRPLSYRFFPGNHFYLSKLIQLCIGIDNCAMYMISPCFKVQHM